MTRSEMQESPGIREALRSLYDAFSANDRERFERDVLTAEDAGVVVIGTAPHEWYVGREKWVEQFGMEGIRLEPGEILAYEEGSLGFAIDRPTFVFPDGTRFPVRLTIIARKQDDRWKVVHGHFSVGVPDEEAMALIAKQSGG